MIRSLKKTAIMAAICGASLSAWGTSYKLDPSHGEVGFSVKHLMISTVKGHFNKYEGSFHFDEAKNEISKVDVKIDAKSINTNDTKRDDHLKGDDFFATEKNPNLTFKSDKPIAMVNKKAKVPGVLNMRGVSKPVVLEVEYIGAVTDAWGNDRVGFNATTTVNRKDFGIIWNKALDKGGVTVGEEVTIHIDGEAIKEKAAAPAAAAPKK